MFQGRADDQVKLGGRRIELGEVDNALQNLPGVSGAAAAVKKTAAGNQLLVGYIASTDPDFDLKAAHALLSEQLPAALVPRLALMDELPTRTSGKVDRNALPWPLPGAGEDAGAALGLDGTAAWVAGLWGSILGAQITGLDDDFFEVGGGSLSAAQLVTALRERFPEVTVAQLYDHPRLGSLAEYLDELAPTETVEPRIVAPTPLKTQLAQIAVTVPLTTLTGLQWVTWLAIANNVLGWFVDVSWAPTVSWWWILLAFIVFITPIGRMTIAVVGARLLLRKLEPGTYPRGGSEHLRLWIALRLTEASGAANLSGAPWMLYYARALGADIGSGVDLHTLPPITGMLELGDGCSVEPEVDLSGHWIDGDVIHIGEIKIGDGASVGSRSTLLPGARIGRDAVVEPGSAVFGRVKANQQWAGSPATKVGKANHPWPAEHPKRAPGWVPVYGVTSVFLGRYADLRADGRDRIDRLVDSRHRHARERSAPIADHASRRDHPEFARLRSRHPCGRSSSLDRADPRLPPCPQPHRLAGVGDRTPARLGQNLPLPAVREPADTGMAPPSRRQDRQERRSLHRAPPSQVHDGRRRRIPR